MLLHIVRLSLHCCPAACRRLGAGKIDALTTRVLQFYQRQDHFRLQHAACVASAQQGLVGLQVRLQFTAQRYDLIQRIAATRSTLHAVQSCHAIASAARASPC